MIVATDVGEAILKAKGNPQGVEALAFDWVGSELGRWFGLVVPECAIASLSDAHIDFTNEYALEPGSSFLSRYMTAEPYDGTDNYLEKLAKPTDIARLVVFDTWIRNDDRYPPDGEAYGPSKNLDNLLFSPRLQGRVIKYDVVVFDHTHAFSSSGYDGLSDTTIAKTEGVYGLFPKFEPYIDIGSIRAAVRRLLDVDERVAMTVLNSLPLDWGITTSIRNAWCRLICERAGFVADTIEAQILGQNLLPFEGRMK
jgi:hypothetical protein